MNSFCVGLLEALLRSGLALTLSATFVLLFLRYVPVASPRIRRLAFFAVVLQGCLLVRIPVTYFAAAPQKAIASQAIESEVERSQAIRQLAFEIAEAVFTNSLVPTVTAKPLTAATRFPLVAMVLGLWTLGIVVLFGRSLWHYVRFIRQLSFCAETPAEWEHEWKTMQQQCGSRHRVALRLTEAVGPLVCWHPRGYQLIVPVEVWRLLTSRQRLLILRHELAHLQRGDIWKSLVIRLMALAHWFNPLVWWMVRRFDEDAECSCDDAVRNSGPKIAIDYARTLLLLGGSHGSTFLTTQAASGPGLADRIRRMIVPTPRKDSNMKKILIATMVLGISTLHLLRIELKADDKPAVEPVTAIDGGVNLVVETAEGDGVHIQADRAIVFRENSSAKVPTNRTEAVVDVRQVMENLTEYHQRRESLKTLISKMEVEFAARRYNAAQKPMPLKEVEFAELETIKKRISEDLLQKETEISISLYKKIMDEAGQFAQENQIQIVRKKTPTVNKNVSNVSVTSPQTVTVTFSDGTNHIGLINVNVADKNSTLKADSVILEGATLTATSIGANDLSGLYLVQGTTVANGNLNVVADGGYGIFIANGSGDNSNKDNQPNKTGVFVNSVNVFGGNGTAITVNRLNPEDSPKLENAPVTNRKVLSKAVQAKGDGSKEILSTSVEASNMTLLVTNAAKYDYIVSNTDGGAEVKARQVRGEGTKENPYYIDMTPPVVSNVVIQTRLDGHAVDLVAEGPPAVNVGPLISDSSQNFVGSFDFMPGSATAKDYWESLMQKDVLYVAPGNDYDISAEILKRMNDKFQKEQQAKPANKNAESK